MQKGVWSAIQLSDGVLVSEQLQVSSVNDRPPVLELENVGLEIPVLTTETRSLKSTLVRSVTGGRLCRSRGGAVVTALQNISLTIRQGGRVALIGHNGAGKSSFLRLVSEAHQHTPTSKPMCRFSR